MLISLDITISITVTGIANITETFGHVIYDLAIGIKRTHSRTRILTFVTNTSKIRGAVGTQKTFRPTALIRITNI